MSLRLTGQSVLGHKAPSDKCKLELQLFNLSLEFENAFVSPFAFRATASAREAFPNDLVLVVCEPLPDWFSVMQRLLNLISNRPMQYEFVAAAFWAALRSGGKLLRFGLCLLSCHANVSSNSLAIRPGPIFRNSRAANLPAVPRETKCLVLCIRVFIL